MSGLYHFVLEINGKGGHGSRPDLAHSVIDCFHDIYSNLDTLRLKYIKPNTVLFWILAAMMEPEPFTAFQMTGFPG